MIARRNDYPYPSGREKKSDILEYYCPSAENEERKAPEPISARQEIDAEMRNEIFPFPDKDRRNLYD